MALKSRLSNKYPVAPPGPWLTGADYGKLDPVFVGRLSYLAKDKGVKLRLTEGFRSSERQAELYRQYLEYLRTGKGSIKLAAKPGTSRHEYRLAVDTSTQPIRGMTSEQLAKYGLCKPINSEPWHIEPIELIGLNINQIKQKYLPEEVEDLSEEYIKKIIDEGDPVYRKPSDLPSWAQPTINKYIKEGYINPEPDGSVNLRHSMVRLIVIMDRRMG